MAEERQRIIKLGQKITDRIGHKVTVEDPEYWGLQGIVTDEMAELALKMKVRVPITAPQLAKKAHKSIAEVEKLLAEMSNVGLVEYNWENERHEKQYVLPMFVPGSAEFTNMNLDMLKAHPELADFFERMSFLPLEKITPMVPLGGAGIGMHVIPVEQAISAEQKSIDIEHISYWLKKYDGKYAASPCSCRYSRRIRNENTGDDPESWCIAVGDMADYVVETNKGGRYITYDEAIAILKQAEDNGYVHQITNIDGENKIFAICNCNISICYALRTSQLFNTPNMSRSAYVAKIDKSKCVACGRCVEYCPAGAVKLGQKLATKHGEVAYPKQELPDNVRWGKDKWNEDYRNTNRINCHTTGTAPCKVNCPAHIAVQGYLKLAALGRYDDALALIKKENPFPAICGRVCNRRCEAACTRGTIDEAVAIDEVKKFIAERDLQAATRYIPPMVRPSTSEFEEKIAIIGAGPAGLSCAFYLAEMGYKPVVFEKNAQAGGMLTYGIPSFKLEKSVINAEIEIIREMGVEIRCGVEVGKDITLAQLRDQGYKAFYVAIGCQGGKRAGIPGEDADGVTTAVDFLKKVIEDETVKQRGRTVVIGGGNVAIDAARYALRCGADATSLVCLESREEMPASTDEIAEAEADGIVIQCGYGPKEIVVKNGKACAVVLKRCVSVTDENGRFNPKYDEDDTVTVECENIIMSIGQSIVWGDLLLDSKVKLGRGNAALADKLTYQTDEPDVFVGGDVYTGPKFAIDAIAAGKEGAVSIHRFVRDGSSLTIGRNRREFIEFDKQEIEIDEGGYDTARRQISGMIDSSEKLSFRDTRCTLTEEQIKKETARCLGCGVTIVDENKCIGCGVCTTKCMFDAITLSRDLPDASRMIRSEDKLKAILPNMIKRHFRIKKHEKQLRRAEKSAAKARGGKG